MAYRVESARNAEVELEELRPVAPDELKSDEIARRSFRVACLSLWPARECLLPALLRIVELHRGRIEGHRVEGAPGPSKR